MAEYTYEDIIMDPEDPRLEGAIGKECYFNDSPKMILEHANNNSPNNFFSLKEINKNNEYPFTDGKYEDVWTLIIIKKEEPKKYVPFETLDEFIESYKKAEERIDYSNIEDYIASCGIWLRFNNDDVMCAVTEIWADGVFLGHDHMKIKWEELLNFYTFIDDSPCGKLMEVKDL